MRALLFAVSFVVANLVAPASAESVVLGVPIRCILEHELAHAGGWPIYHPGAVYRRGCGLFEMPPHRFPLAKGVRPVVHRLPLAEVQRRCGGEGYVGCSEVGGNTPHVWVPK